MKIMTVHKERIKNVVKNGLKIEDVSKNFTHMKELLNIGMEHPELTLEEVIELYRAK